MAADLSIHVMDGITSDDLKCFNSSSIGSKYFNLNRIKCKDGCSCKHWKAVSSSPQVWIGEVSWLKAALFGDSETYCPGPVVAIQELIGEDEPVLTKSLKRKILKALDVDNATSYAIAKKEDVEKFLDEHMGKKLFTVSW